MSENERPALGSPEAAVRSIVNLISLATHTDEDKLAYWLDAYYQLRAAYERDDAPAPDMPDPADLAGKLDALAEQVEKSMGIIGGYFINISGALLNEGGPSRAPAPAEEPEGGQQVAAPTEEDGKPSSGAARHLPLGEGNGESKELPPAILKSSRVLPSADQAAIQSKKRTRSQEAAAADRSQRAYKMRVADRLRKVRAEGVTTAQIVEAGHGSVPDGAVLGIVGGEFRPIADYRAIEAALDTLETE